MLEKKLYKFDFVFVVLVYRNTKDLKEFFMNFRVPNSKVVVVNSYYDDITESEFKNLSEINNADFLSVENRGYGAGNNAGIQYAIGHYDFEYIVISNADIIIEDFQHLPDNKVITAPDIKTLKNKQQNPHTPYHIKWLDKYKYYAFTKWSPKALYFSIGFNKFNRCIFSCLNKIGICKSIYAAHGAFIIIPKSILIELHPIFDEKMFLFAEEDVLAYKARKKGIKIEYNHNIKIRHKEDGSVSSISSRVYNILKDSYIYFYEHYCQKS